MDSEQQFLRFFIHEDIYCLAKEVIDFQDDTPKSQHTDTTDETAVTKPSAPVPAPTPKQLPPPVLVHKGSNHKKVAVLFHTQEQTDIDTTLENFLMKILAAVKLDIEDIALIHTKDFDTEQAEAQLDLLRPTVVIAFNCTPPMKTPSKDLYSIYKSGNTSVLLADDLALLHTDKMKKKQLWEALQLLFL